jgi:hypothetical protein
MVAQQLVQRHVRHGHRPVHRGAHLVLHASGAVDVGKQTAVAVVGNVEARFAGAGAAQHRVDDAALDAAAPALFDAIGDRLDEKPGPAKTFERVGGREGVAVEGADFDEEAAERLAGQRPDQHVFAELRAKLERMDRFAAGSGQRFRRLALAGGLVQATERDWNDRRLRRQR